MSVSRAFDWYVNNPKELRKHAGKHVAIVDNEITDVGDSAKEVYEKAKKKYPDKSPLLTYIPKGETLIL
ncbi:hypothetical protein CW713_07170 [Methanophagales archaeon]|nr:MAG: hypothetical protein CW714_01335 [Methanophagales archaeon]RJS80801.1 MAG: hypothetical protein CW713_07170 [Methanophagales archaeon]